MTKTTKHNADEFVELLPWYVNGTLDVATTAAIDEALKTDDALRRNLESALEDQGAALELAELDDIPQSMSARFDAQLEREIETSSLQAAADSSKPGLMENLGNWLQNTLLAGSRPRLAFAAIAATLVILLQSGAIISQIVGGDGSNIDLASDGSAEIGTDIVFLVQLNQQAVISDLSEHLETSGGKIIDGPLAGGMYKLGFTKEDEKSAGSILTELKEREELFSLVLPAQGQ